MISYLFTYTIRIFASFSDYVGYGSPICEFGDVSPGDSMPCTSVSDQFGPDTYLVINYESRRGRGRGRGRGRRRDDDRGRRSLRSGRRNDDDSRRKSRDKSRRIDDCTGTLSTTCIGSIDGYDDLIVVSVTDVSGSYCTDASAQDIQPMYINHDLKVINYHGYNSSLFTIIMSVLLLLSVLNIIFIWKYGCCGWIKGEQYKYKVVKFEDVDSECDSSSEIVPIKQ